MRTSKLLFLIPLLALAIGIFFFSSCKKNFDTGLSGKVSIGEGDCMPVVVESNRTYHDYNGYIYCIVKADLDSLHGSDPEQLKQNSIKQKIRNGNLNLELPPGTYVIMPENVYEYSPENTITITEGQVLHQDFKFFICLSY